ncbi:MAG: LysM peptidoglycan-binding domain-containing protein [Cytophagales bacterium]|nr:LysM peptidoglycan-binding domain-containing protein [Cytophagales bacterium]
MSISYRYMITALCCCWLLGARGNWIATDSLRLEERDGRYFVIHEVEAKETLYSLSRRYATEIDSIKANNELRNGGIDLGQVLKIPVAKPAGEATQFIVNEVEEPLDARRKFHTVMSGETVYSLSRRYEIEASDLRSWNGLSDNNLSIGDTLYVSPPSVADKPEAKEEANDPMDDEAKVVDVITELPTKKDTTETLPEDVVEALPSAEVIDKDSIDYYTHYVQSGETLSQLARRFETIPDSLISWNGLETSTLRIGDKLLVKKVIEHDSLNHSRPRTRFTSYGSRFWIETTDQDTLVHEEGIAGTIENIIETRKFLALHRTLPVGAVMKVVNLMNHESLEVRVVGKLPNTGLNRNMMIRFTDATFKQLGIIDKKSRVEIIYSEIKG